MLWKNRGFRGLGDDGGWSNLVRGSDDAAKRYATDAGAKAAAHPAAAPLLLVLEHVGGIRLLVHGGGRERQDREEWSVNELRREDAHRN